MSGSKNAARHALRGWAVSCALVAIHGGLLRAQEPDSKEETTKEPENRLNLSKLLEWETVSTPRLSPDGQQIVFSRGWIDKVNDKRVNELWIMNSDGTRPRHLTEGSEPQWSSDGTRIAFLKEGKPRGTQIHVMWVDTREVTQITRLDEGPSNIRWSPDSREICFNMIVKEKQGFDVQLPKRPEGAKWADDPTVITRLNYRRDQSGYRPSGYRHIFVVDAGGGTPLQVTSGDFDHEGCEWMPGESAIVFSGLRQEDADWQRYESEVYSVSLPSKEIKQLTTRKGPDGGPIVSPDGRFIAYVGFDENRDTYTVPELFVMESSGGNPVSVTKRLDRAPGSILWSKDSRSLYVSIDSEGARDLYTIDLQGNAEKLTFGDQFFTASDVSADGLVVGTLTDSQLPLDIASFRPVPGISPEFQLLTDVNADVLRGVDVGQMDEIWYPSVDGFMVQGWIVKPPDFDPAKKYPLILQIHGGPHAMYNVGFDFERQNHAAEGFVVLYTNPRGSTGYGKTFGNAINNAYPSKDYDDLMGAVDKTIAQGYVDEKNLFVYGGSGGGVLTCWIVGHTDRFRAAVSMFPVTNWISFVGTTDGPYWYYNFAKLPWEDITEHWNRSPLKYVGNVTTPTMLITGELDLRTPMAQTEEYYQALKYRKVDTVMVRIPDEYHGAAGRHVSNQLRRILYVREWFKRHQDGKESPPTEGVGTH